MDFSLTPENYDGVVSALLGNGELCTTVGPTGFHTPPEEQTDVAHRTQRFYLAGRRSSGPQHPLIDFGTLTRRLYLNGTESRVDPVWQKYNRGWEVVSEVNHGSVREVPRCYIAAKRNCFCADIPITNKGDHAVAVELRVEYRFGQPDGIRSVDREIGGICVDYELDGHLGQVSMGAEVVGISFRYKIDPTASGAILTVRTVLQPGNPILVTVWLHFSDRLRFEFATDVCDTDRLVKDHEAAWRAFMSDSTVITGDERVDRFREMSLYTLRCQATPWSIPPTLSEPYWGAGTFHDEMYPFLGLLSSGHTELAERVPYFRLTTLPQAMQRARGRGALYPWSSTEYGEERDPNGLWLTERFHLGQFAVCIWMLWLYNRDRIQLDDLYRILREIARYFEMNMLERDSDGRLRTKACVDFDESVGEVTNGPFTICAAIASMEYAANAAEELGRDPERIPRWRSLAAELRQNLPTTESATDRIQPRRHGDTEEARSGQNPDPESELGVLGVSAVASPLRPIAQRPTPVFAIPDGKPLHYSIIGPVFPFRVEVDSERARASAEVIHRICRSTKGWKSGLSEPFEGSNWMWTAGHLGIVHVLQGNAELAWEAIREGPASAGPFLSPNEHVDKDGVIHVPWFTTGCGAWLYALNCLFVQVDEEGTRLLPAVPQDLLNVRFHDLLAEHKVRVSGTFEDGRLVSLTAAASRDLQWRYRIPAAYADGRNIAGEVTLADAGWLHVNIALPANQAVSLIDN